jgi:hypothetical protein
MSTRPGQGGFAIPWGSVPLILGPVPPGPCQGDCILDAYSGLAVAFAFGRNRGKMVGLRSKGLASAVVVSILSIGAGPMTFPTDEEQARIAEPYSACLRAQAERIDDGHTDIAVIARDVAAACKAQFEEMVATLGKNQSAEDQQTLRDRLSEMQTGYASVEIGRLRIERHQPVRPH